MKVVNFLGHVCAALMALMVISVLYGVLTRYLLGNQAGWTEELARYLLVWISLLGAAYATAQRKHIAIQLLPDSLEPPAARRLSVVIDVIIIFFVLFAMVGGGLYYVYITLSLGQQSPALGIPVGFVYTVVPISGLFVIFFLVKDIIHGH